MKFLTKTILIGLIATGIGSGAWASSYECESEPKSEWKAEAEAKALLVAQGYQIRTIKVEGGCYEFYATKDGQRFEIFVNPATLKVVKVKAD